MKDRLCFRIVFCLFFPPLGLASWLGKSVPVATNWGRNVVHQIRSGDSSSKVEEGGEDEDRYSRQVYTLGARAHALVRSSTVYLDGPSASGLVYECAKNLALSGVGHLVLLRNSLEDVYHNPRLDDLGKAYQRAARSEIKDDTSPDQELLVEYLRRLNPSLVVTVEDRSFLEQGGKQIAGGVLVCLDRPYSTQVELNVLARQRNLKFVAAETAGVYGRTFCDFGPSFQVYDMDGETPLVVPLDRLEAVDDEEADDLMQVYCVDGEKHDVSKGDTIQFQLSDGELMKQSCSVVSVSSPQLFTVRLQSKDVKPFDFLTRVNKEAAAFRRIKIPHDLTFQALEDAMESSKEEMSLFTPCDLDKSFDSVRRSAVVSSFQALSKFVKTEGRLPKLDDSEAFLDLVANSWSAPTQNSDWEQHCMSFVKSCAAKFTPLQAIFGAISAQEALKAVSGLYNPIFQFLLYDCDEVLDATDGHQNGDSGQSYILGQHVEDALSTKRIFVVGAGAIGCELLKNLAAMGAGVGKNGCVVLTDMDTIEKSNLSRQLLFRDADIGKFKSAAAHEAMRRFNPEMKMEVHTSKVGDSDQGPFGDKFWSKKVDILLNALDNVEARLYMDRQCVSNTKAMVDAGTMGSKGNVQVVVPNQSESYGSSVDPPEPAIPVCTLKNFPYAISHTIQWGRDLFDGLFERRPRQANDYANLLKNMDVSDFTNKLIHDLGKEAAMEVGVELGEDLESEIVNGNIDEETVRRKALEWAVQLSVRLFHDSVKQLLHQHPPDSVDEDGEPFWSGSRKVPKVLSYSVSDSQDPQQDIINKSLIDFVSAASRLRIESFRGRHSDAHLTKDEIEVALSECSYSEAPKSEEDAAGDGTAAAILSRLGNATPVRKRELSPVEFEKDDDSNGHVAFVTAASNLRAICYGIPPVDAMETRRVAGKIVPAMITTTAFVSALSCIELVKLLQRAPLNRHRNAFINLALPFFAFTAPLPAEEIEGFRGRKYTLWDRLVIKEGKKAAKKGGMTLGRLLKLIKEKAHEDTQSLEIVTISFGPYMLYANFLHEDDEEIMDKVLWDLLSETMVEGDNFDSQFSSRGDGSGFRTEEILVENQSYVDFTVVVEDTETGEEFELPPVRVKRSKTSQTSSEQ